MKEILRRQLLSYRRGRSCGWRTGSTTRDCAGNFRPRLSGDGELHEYFQLASGDSQEDGVRLMKKIPRRGRVTIWPIPSAPRGLRFLASNFRVWPSQRREEVQLSSVHW
jgi:hypothetical protein